MQISEKQSNKKNKLTVKVYSVCNVQCSRLITNLIKRKLSAETARK